MKKLSNTEADLKKCVTYKKGCKSLSVKFRESTTSCENDYTVPFHAQTLIRGLAHFNGVFSPRKIERYCNRLAQET